MLTRLVLILFLAVPAKPAWQPAYPGQGKAGIQAASAAAPAQASAAAQSTVAVSDPTAVALASRALQSLAGGTALSDITLQANATYVAGSDEETGMATLVARGNAQSLVTLNLTGGQRQEVRNGVAGYWTGPDGTQARHGASQLLGGRLVVLSWSGPPSPVGRPDPGGRLSRSRRMERRGSD